ncbi:hypothetical protein AAY473_010871 [Plecturocebus cupreus]
MERGPGTSVLPPALLVCPWELEDCPCMPRAIPAGDSPWLHFPRVEPSSAGGPQTSLVTFASLNLLIGQREAISWW